MRAEQVQPDSLPEMRETPKRAFLFLHGLPMTRPQHGWSGPDIGARRFYRSLAPLRQTTQPRR